MIGGKWCQQTDLGLGVVPDSFTSYETAFRALRRYLDLGNQVYLPTDPAANAAWWSGKGYDTSALRLHRALSSVKPQNIETLGPEDGFVLEFPGPASAQVFPVPNEWALADPNDLWDIGDVPIWSQPIPTEPNFEQYESLNGGW